MPTTMTFTEDMENPVTSVYDLDRLKLDTGEFARIALLTNGFDHGSYHHIKPNDGTQSYGNYYECVGPGCFACKYAMTGQDVPVSIPKLRGIAQVAHIVTNKIGDVENPKHIAMNYRLYTLNASKIRDLVRAFKEYKMKSMEAADILIECVNGQFHNHKINVVPNKLTVLSTGSATEQFQDLQDRVRDDIGQLIGRTVTPEIMEHQVRDALNLSHDDTTTEQEQIQATAEVVSETLDDLLF